MGAGRCGQQCAGQASRGFDSRCTDAGFPGTRSTAKTASVHATPIERAAKDCRRSAERVGEGLKSSLFTVLSSQFSVRGAINAPYKAQKQPQPMEWPNCEPRTVNSEPRTQ